MVTCQEDDKKCLLIKKLATGRVQPVVVCPVAMGQGPICCMRAVGNRMQDINSYAYICQTQRKKSTLKIKLIK